VLSLFSSTTLFRSRGLYALRLLHDVEIGEDVAARIDHKARARAFHRHGVEEEVVFDHAGDDIGHGWRGLAIDAHVYSFFVTRMGRWRGRRSGLHRGGQRLSVACLTRAPACFRPLSRPART